MESSGIGGPVMASREQDWPAAGSASFPSRSVSYTVF